MLFSQITESLFFIYNILFYIYNIKLDITNISYYFYFSPSMES